LFSRRLPADLRENRLAEALRRRRGAGLPLLDLTESNPTRAGLLDSIEGPDGAALLAPLADPRGLRYAPSPRGDGAARRAVADYYGRRGLAVDPERLVLCASTSEAYAWLFQLLCDVGDEVLYPQPSYPLFEHLAALCAVRLVPYPLRYDGGWSMDLPALAAACSARTRAVLLVNPNNPTGSLLRQEERQALRALCRERGLCLIVDEVFGDFRLGPPLPDRVASLIDEEEAPCFVLSGLSKVLGLPQLKLGWIHVGGPAPLRAAAQDRLELIADTFLSVGTPVQLAAPALLGRQPALGGAIAARVQAGYRCLQTLAEGTACQLLRADGGWYGVLRLPRLCSEEEWALRFLEEDGVLCHPGYFFDFWEEAYVVLSLLTRPEELEEGTRRLLRRVQRS
jgi:alanine-synthesizing transaminase